MNENEQKPSLSGDTRSHSPASVISRFSYEEYQDSNIGESPHTGHESTASRRSSISASSQPSPNHIGLARPLSAAMISSNDRFTSSASATPDLPRGHGLGSTEQIVSKKNSEVTAEPYNQQEKRSDKGREPPMWNPFWLWRTTLMGFTFVLILLVAVLVILYHFSNLHHGLSAQSSSNHYSWTYGPTAGELIFNQDRTPNTNGTSIHDPTLCMAAGRLLLQDPSTLEGDAGPTSDP